MIRRIALVATLGLAAAALAREDIRPDDPIIAGIVAYSLEHHHYSAQPVNDALSSRWLDAWLNLVDGNKMFLLAEDVVEIEGHRRRLDDTLKGQTPDLAVGFDLDDLWQRRYLERLDFVDKALLEGLAESAPQTVDLDREDDQWAGSTEALDELWRKRLLAEVIRFRLQDRSHEEAMERLKRRFHRMRTDFEERESADVLETWLAALGQAYDPHSVWFKPITKENFDIDMRDTFQGIGARLQVDGEYTVVSSLVAGGPAQKGGELKPQDRIVGVAQGDDEPEDVIDMPLNRVVKLIRGEKGTTVVLTVLSEDAIGPSDTHQVRIVRDQVVIEDASAESRVVEVDGTKVGIIDLPSFYQNVSQNTAGEWVEVRSTTVDVRRILGEFQAQQVGSVVLDLRYNTGGSLKQAIDLSGLFIESGPIVQVKGRQDDIQVHPDPDPELVYAGPLVVLVNGYSASASEILAGAIKDYGRGVVVGTGPTFGKGSVQELVDLAPMVSKFAGPQAGASAGALKLTRQQFYRVSGKSTQNTGVVPDVLIPSPQVGRGDRESALPNSLPYDEIEAVSFTRWHHDLRLPALARASERRVAKSSAFRFVKVLSEYFESTDARPLSLDLEERRAQVAESEAIQARGEEAGYYGEDVDPVLDETLRVAVDLASP